MPELPEVETIKRGLIKFCLHKKIERVQVFCEKSFIGPKEIVVGQEIIGFRRFGKALIIDLSGNISLMIHLRMTGQLIYRSPDATSFTQTNATKSTPVPPNSILPLLTDTSFAGGHPTDSFFTELPNKQTRVLFELDDGTLYFNDQRKFGFVKVIPTAEVENDKFIASLAPEPWQTDPVKLHQVFQKKKNSEIKAVILDQKVIAGIGNIYADEALFFAKIHPKRRAGTLTLAETKDLVTGACQVMDASISSGGSTMATYVRADGTKGDYLENFAKVFRREGQPCERCGTEIIKIRAAGRGTHICPHCQQSTPESAND